MTITASQVKSIGQELSKLKPKKIKLDGNRTLTVREAIFALAPTLIRLQKRNFELPEIVQLLHEKGIEIKPATLSRYLNDYQRSKDKKAHDKTDKKSMSSKTNPLSQSQTESTAHWGGFEIRPYIPDGEL